MGIGKRPDHGMSPFPKCPVCKNPHASGAKHVWDDERPMVELVDTPDLKSVASQREGSSPSGPTIQARSSAEEHQPSKLLVAGSIPAAPTNDIRRGFSGRDVAASASDPVTVGYTNRDDELAARQGEIPHISVESSRPPQLITPVAQRTEHRTTNPRVGGSIPSGCATSSKPPFDETARRLYQRDYMRDLPKARAEGLTVKAWRVKHGKE